MFIHPEKSDMYADCPGNYCQNAHAETLRPRPIYSPDRPKKNICRLKGCFWLKLSFFRTTPETIVIDYYARPRPWTSK